MEEQRQFFRIENKGIIQAYLENKPLEVVNISSNGILIINKKIDIPKQGIIKITISSLTMNVTYELLRVENNTIAVVLKKEEEINTLFPILKKLRDKQL